MSLTRKKTAVELGSNTVSGWRGASEFSPVAILEDTRKDYGETRYRAFGFVEKPHALASRLPKTESHGKRVRAISLPTGTKQEIKNYGLSKKADVITPNGHW